MGHRISLLLVSMLTCLLAPSGASAAGPARGGGASDRAAGMPGVRVTMPPAGLSIEYPTLASLLGTSACPPPSVAAELVHLGSPPLRIGGDSQDLATPSEGLPAVAEAWRAATLYQLPAGFWTRLGCLLAATHDPLTVGLNLESGNLAWAQQIVAGARQAASAGLSFSIGNEPDLYPLPDYSSLGNRTVDVAAAVGLYLRLAGLLRPALGGNPLIGPDLARPAAWRPWLPLVLTRLGVAEVGVHEYPLSGCLQPAGVTLHGLLSRSVADAPTRLAWVVADAAADGIPALISEANSASCGGKPGVSDTPAAAVWGVRFALSALRTGFREVRFHLSGGAYDPFTVRGGALRERPLGAAIAALNRWLPVGCSLYEGRARRGLSITAVRGSPSVHSILDNETGSARRVVLPASTAVQVQLLQAGRYGIATLLLTPKRGRLALSLPPQSIAALR